VTLHFKTSGDVVNIVSRVPELTSNISEVDGLSVGVEQLDDGVVVVLHSAANGGHFPLDDRHVVSCQVLTVNCTTQAENADGASDISSGKQTLLTGYSRVY